MELFQILLNGFIGALLLSTGILSAMSLCHDIPTKTAYIFAAVFLAIHRFTVAYFTSFEGMGGFLATPPSLFLNLMTVVALVALNVILLMPKHKI